MRTYIYKVILMATAFGTLGASNANAGFEFTAPIQTSAPQQQAIPSLNGSLLPTLPNITMQEQDAPMPAVPNAPVNSQPVALAPQNNRTPVAPVASPVSAPRAPQTGIASLAPQQQQMVQPMQQPSAMAATPAPSTAPTPTAASTPTAAPTPSMNGYDMAVGFGKNLPLVTALRQVVPNDYAYVLNDDVPMGKTVSWDGGRPWNVVLNEMIEPLGLKSNIDGSRVLIERAVRPMTRTAMAPTYETPVMNDAMPEPMDMPMQVEPMPTPPSAPAPVVNMSVSAPQSVAQFSAPVAPIPSRIVPQVTRGTWSANRGDSLRSVLQEWSGQAGAELFWSSDFDYPLAGAVNISGTFEEATENLLKGFEQARPKPIARLHPNLPHGPAVLVVETRQTLD